VIPQIQEGKTMRRYWEFSLISLLIFAVAPPPHAIAGTSRPVGINAYDTQPDVPRTRIYIHSSMADTDAFAELRQRLVDGGAVHVNYFEPSLVVCEVPMTVSIADLLADPNFSYFEESFVGPHMASPAADEINNIKAAYDRVEAVVDLQKSGEWRMDFTDVVKIVPPETIRESMRPRQVPGDNGLPVAAPVGIPQGAEFMIGDIHVNTVYPESDGTSDPNSEQWTDDELRDVSQGVIAAMLAFQQTWDYISINFAFSFYNRVQTRYEPIAHNMDSDYLWIADCMANIQGGPFTGRDEMLAVHELNNSKRGGPNPPDWVFTIFVADGSAEGGRFRGANYTAYAQLGGPYNIMPFPTNPANNPNNLDMITLFAGIMMHETIHIFWGLDEYESAPSICSSRSGYLNYENRNKVSTPPGGGDLMGCPTYVHCLMWDGRSAEQPLCFYTAGQVGTVDANENDIPDLFDMPPTIEFEDGSNVEVEDASYTINMKAISQSVPNRNPFQTDGVDYAARLKSASFSINGVGLTLLKPVDGKWDETEEDLVVRLNGLSPGETTVRVAARNAYGRLGAQELKINFVGINFGLFGITVAPNGLNVEWKTIGRTYGATYVLHRFDSDTGQPREKTYDSTQFTESTDGDIVTFRLLDEEVKPGRTYRYQVHATFEYNGGQRDSNTGIVEARAMLAIEEGSSLSYAAPNPFRDATQITLDIPSVVVTNPQTSSGPTAASAFNEVIPTPVSISIYDVLGRQVKEVYRGEMFAQKETFTWDGTNARGDRVPSGVYFVRARAGDRVEVKKVVVVR